MATISIPVMIDRPTDPTLPTHAGVLDSAGRMIGSILCRGSLANTRRELKATTLRALSELQDMRDNYEQRIIGCTDGTVLIVQYRNGCWCYRIAGKGRNCACTCLFNSEATYQDTLENARKHAESSFGGISWDHQA